MQYRNLNGSTPDSFSYLTLYKIEIYKLVIVRSNKNMVRRNTNTAMLNARQVARLLNIHINTVRRWSNQGILKAYRIGPRGDRRFKHDDIAVFLS